MSNDASNQPGFNPYKAPAAEVMGVAADDPGVAPFFPVSGFKMGIMSIATIGLYLIYWFYKNWRCVQATEKINVLVRTIFYPVTAYSFFRRVREKAGDANVAPVPNAGALAFLLFILSMSSNAPDPYWMVSLGAFLPLLPVQATINEINRKVAPGADPNNRFTAANIAWLAVGAILWILIFVGLFAGE